MSDYMLEARLKPNGLGSSGEAPCGCVVDVQDDMAHVMLCDRHEGEYERGRGAGFFEGQGFERKQAVALVTVLDKILTMIEAGTSFGDIQASLDAGGELARRAAKAYLNR